MIREAEVVSGGADKLHYSSKIIGVGRFRILGGQGGGGGGQIPSRHMTS